MIKNNLIIYLAILIFGLAAPFVFPAFKVQLSILCILITLSLYLESSLNVQTQMIPSNFFQTRP